MSKLLVVYGTREGQTGKIAEVISEELSRSGHSVDLFDARDIPKSVLPDQYDTVIVGGPVHKSDYPRELRSWIRAHHERLSRTRSAFFSVCLGILQDDEKVKQNERSIVMKFLDSTGWNPTRWTIFAGALRYSRYNWLIKRIMRSQARKAGTETDMTRDYEYTDWDKVKNFAREVANFSANPEADKKVSSV